MRGQHCPAAGHQSSKNLSTSPDFAPLHILVATSKQEQAEDHHLLSVGRMYPKAVACVNEEAHDILHMT